MTIKFTHDAAVNGYSFLAGEVHSFPDHVGEAIIRDGVAYQVASKREQADDKSAGDALNEAKHRDLGSNGRS